MKPLIYTSAAIAVLIFSFIAYVAIDERIDAQTSPSRAAARQIYAEGMANGAEFSLSKHFLYYPPISLAPKATASR